MPEIEGLKEQQDALKRIKSNLKEIEDVNKFLKGVSELAANGDVQGAHEILISFTDGEDVKRFRCPLRVPDNRFVFEAAQAYKDEIVRKVRQDATDYRISLSPKDNATLDWRLV